LVPVSVRALVQVWALESVPESVRAWARVLGLESARALVPVSVLASVLA
jgi:hypothetical protein